MSAPPLRCMKGCACCGRWLRCRCWSPPPCCAAPPGSCWNGARSCCSCPCCCCCCCCCAAACPPGPPLFSQWRGCSVAASDAKARRLPPWVSSTLCRQVLPPPRRHGVASALGRSHPVAGGGCGCMPAAALSRHRRRCHRRQAATPPRHPAAPAVPPPRPLLRVRCLHLRRGQQGPLRGGGLAGSCASTPAVHPPRCRCAGRAWEAPAPGRRRPPPPPHCPYRRYPPTRCPAALRAAMPWPHSAAF